ncbi:hypothetical protein [Mucilaginibacter sp.]
MKQQEVFKKIGGIIKELSDQYEYLKTTDEPLNELELELFLANSNFLTDHLLILTKLNAQNTSTLKIDPSQKVEAPYEQTYFEPLVRISTPEPHSIKEKNIIEAPKQPINDTPVPTIDLEAGSIEDTYALTHEDETETIRHELILDEADWEEEQDSPAIVQQETDLEEDKIDMPPEPARHVFFPEQEPLRDTEALAESEPVFETEYKEPTEVYIAEPQYAVKSELTTEKEPEKPEVLTINERISAQMAAKQGITEQLQPQAISDLKQAINLNDKLLFIKDLFNGYSLAYSEAIEILNRFAGLEEADQFLKKNYVVKNQWEAKPETTAKFYALLKRRYA